MPSTERDREADIETADTSTEVGPALRDASAATERAARDEADAAEARERYRTDPLPTLPPDERIAGHLADGEVVHTLRQSAILLAPGGETELGFGGTLYLTSRRLVHLGQVIVTVLLSDIRESALAGERLLLTLESGEGIAIDIDRPRRFRTDLAAAMRGLRG